MLRLMPGFEKYRVLFHAEGTTDKRLYFFGNMKTCISHSIKGYQGDSLLYFMQKQFSCLQAFFEFLTKEPA